MQSNNLPLKRFNVRVYGLLINELNQILVSDEAFLNGTLAAKFPGGGLELGEGLTGGLKREFVEETGTEVELEDVLKQQAAVKLRAANRKASLLSLL